MIETTLLPTTSAALEALADLAGWADELLLAYAWASSNAGASEHWKVLPLEKITRAVIGTHFAQTEPFALYEMHRLGVLRVVADGEGVFHPKVILGCKSGDAKALIGSSNFTSNGFGANRELNVLLAGAVDHHALASVRAFIDGLWGAPEVFTPDDDWLKKYAATYAKRPKPPPIPERPPPVKLIESKRLSVQPSWFTRSGGSHGITIGDDFRRLLGVAAGKNGEARVFVAGKLIARGAVNADNSGRLTKVKPLFKQLKLTSSDVGREVHVTVEEDAEGVRLAFRRVD